MIFFMNLLSIGTYKTLKLYARKSSYNAFNFAQKEFYIFKQKLYTQDDRSGERRPYLTQPNTLYYRQKETRY